MRISLLLKQEPFGKILEQTLQHYWSQRDGVKYSVIFGKKAQSKHGVMLSNQQTWFGNIYLNVFAVAQTPTVAFDNLKAEYQHTPIRWRRWLQKIYVYSALHKFFRKFFSHAILRVTPAVQGAEDSLILGGNRRLRLLHPAREVSTVILKKGYPSSYITEEIHVRQHLSLDFAPTLGRVSLAEGWYEEAYVKGTPLNRLVGCDKAAIKKEVHALLLHQLIMPTCENVPLHVYMEQVLAKIEQLVSYEHVDEASRACVSTVTHAIKIQAKRWALRTTKIPVAMTHGDFQQANILYDGHHVTVIDWESVARRHAAYDTLVYQLGVRQTSQWPESLRLFITSEPVAVWRQWPGLLSQQERLLTALIFIVDELNMILSEAWEVSFRRPSVKHLKQKFEQIHAALIILESIKI